MNNFWKITIGIVAVSGAGYVGYHLVKTGVHISKVDGTVIWKQYWKYFKAHKSQLVSGNVEDFPAGEFDQMTEEIDRAEYTNLKKIFGA